MKVIQGNRVILTQQVSQTIKQRIRSGQYSEGELLPSIRELCAEFGVGRGVVQNAIRDMESHGIVRAHHGRGVQVESTGGVSSTAILFGIIHPYSSELNFSTEVLMYVNEAFAKRNNFAVVRTSNDDPDEEKRLAEFMLSNGVRGLILWHNSVNANAEYFVELSKKIPVVLVDRQYEGVDLPSVVLDYYTAGREIFETVMLKMKRKKMLVLMDNLGLDTYTNLTSGIEDASRDADRAYDVSYMQFPITHLLKEEENIRAKDVLQFGKHITDIVQNNGYDALMCPHADFLAELMYRKEDMKKLEFLQFITFRGLLQTVPTAEQMLHKASKYHYDADGNPVPVFNCLRWDSDYCDMVYHAANMIQEWMLKRKKPDNNVKVRMNLSEDSSWVIY